MPLTKDDIGKTVSVNTDAGKMTGEIIGCNSHGNFVLKVDKTSPVQGWKVSGYDLDGIIDSFTNDFTAKKSTLKGYTFWHLPEEQEIEKNSDPKQNQSSAVKETTMANEKNALKIIKSDGEAAAYRVAGKRLGQGANALIAKALKSGLSPEHGAAVDAIMSSPAGTVLTQLALGWGITYAPGVGQDPRLQKLAEEFRIQGTAEGMDFFVGGLLEHLTPVLNDALSMLPGGAAEQVRVSDVPAVAAKQPEGELLTLEDVQPEAKKASVGK